MSKEQSQVNIEDEVVAVRVLSAVFVTFMVLIVGSYSEIPRDEVAQNVATHSEITSLNHGVSISAGMSAKLPSLLQPTLLK